MYLAIDLNKKAITHLCCLWVLRHTWFLLLHVVGWNDNDVEVGAIVGGGNWIGLNVYLLDASSLVGCFCSETGGHRNCDEP